jgi:hypothetical protein
MGEGVYDEVGRVRLTWFSAVWPVLRKGKPGISLYHQNKAGGQEARMLEFVP